MLYDYLYEFTVVARERSLLRAASKLGISQPALGRHISALETQLGAQLVTRSARGVQLTPEGRYTLNIALDICALGNALEGHFKRRQLGGIDRQILVGGLSGSRTAQAMLAGACGEISRHGNNVTLRYQMDYSFLSIAEALENREVDIVVAFGNAVEHERLSETHHCVRLLASTGYGIMEREHPLADKATLKLLDLKTTLVGRMEGHQGNSDLQWRELVQCCERTAGFSPLSQVVGFDYVPGWGDWYLPGCVVVFCTDNHNIPQLEASGKRVALIEGLVYEIYAVTRRDDPLCCRLLDMAAEQAESAD